MSEGVAKVMPLFHARGYDDVGVAELSNTIGVKATSLYAAYGNKLGLFERALAHYVECSGGFVGEALSRANSAEDLLPELLRSAAIAYTEHPGRPGCMVLDGELMTSDTQAAELIRNNIIRVRSAIADRFREFGSNEPERNADLAILLMRGISASARTGSSRESLLDAADWMATE
ncbi:TetR/AcrR family transcriptional regulator [Halomonas sp. PR-M31]|uniref:TetR/AcrR family transcriptional regulator n=1 Tax=Halomonas sp. PR-M31 TaxID=1471202 RepID=UPI00069F1BB2|nr:TetR/AcrR family transcriptional regulator [Halomonas sp. PR-M31]